MLATIIPYLHCFHGIYYYRNQSTWKSVRTRFKKDVFRKLSHILFGSAPAVDDTALTEPPKQITSKTNLSKPEDITSEEIHFRGDALKTDNAKRSIPTHPKLISLGLLIWVHKGTKE
jgi:hypothetical protein